MKNRHSQKCFLPSDVSGLDLTTGVSQNVTSFHIYEYSHFWWLWKAFLQIFKTEMLVAFFLSWQTRVFTFLHQTYLQICLDVADLLITEIIQG